MDALKEESLTSQKDWESHNLADIPALARQRAPTTFLGREQFQSSLMACTEELVANLDAAQLGGVLQALLSQLLPVSEPPIRGPRARARLRRLAGQVKRRLTSP